MFVTGLPSLQVAVDRAQPAGADCASEYPLPAGTDAKVRVFESVASASSSSEKLVGLRPPPAVKAKSCASLGCASSTTTTWPRF